VIGVGVGATLPTVFTAFPGAVLVLSRAGVIEESNGALERELQRPLVGQRFAEIVDLESSASKLERALERVRESTEGAVACELVLQSRPSLGEPRGFHLLWDERGSRYWVIEREADPRLDRLREQVTGVNSELANAQRALVKERSRLARALEALEAQFQETARLARTVEERNRELARSNEALDDFAHVVSHDLKAPLRSISIHAEWLAEESGEELPPEARGHLSRIRDRVDRMRELIDGALQYARAGRERSRPELVDAGKLVERVLELLGPPSSVRLQIGPDLPVLRTSRVPLQQVFLNLLSNAVKHADRDDPVVRVAAHEEGGYHVFTVADNGSGIPAEHRDRIWGLFQTLQPEERDGGTGIGLAVVKRIVEAHGGRVWVESEVGAGTRFRFSWPAGAEEDAPGMANRASE
jgi:signal transduction histidine kinase